MKKLIVYDNFYSDPLAIRNLVLDSEFETNDGSRNYSGTNSILSNFNPEMNQFFNWLTGEKLKPALPSCHGHFRLQKSGDTFKQHIHVDFPNFNCTWAAVCYLSLEEHCKDSKATYFWKHKRLGIEEFPIDTQKAADLGFYSPNDLKVFMDTDGIDESKWEMLNYVPQKFNRLVMFRSNLWHSPGELFGDSKDNCRLIQTFFFEPDLS